MNSNTGSKRPTLSDIAIRADVSTWAVSQALRGRPTVSTETRARILAVAGELGYRPNAVARALVSSRTNMVAIWQRWPSRQFSLYYAHMQYHLQLIGRQHYYGCIIEDVVIERDHDFERLMNWPIDGVIACDVGDLKQLRSSIDPVGTLPIVCVGAADQTIDHIFIDLYPGAVQAVRHLIESGYKRIAYLVTGGLDCRFEAYCSVLDESGKPAEPVVFPDLDPQAMRIHLLSYFDEHGMPDAFFCHNDEAAMWCYKTLTDLGIRIPEDVGIVGCDGIPEGGYLPADLTSIVIPMQDVCSTAWTYLLARIADRNSAVQRTVVTPQLVVRASSLRV